MQAGVGSGTWVLHSVVAVAQSRAANCEPTVQHLQLPNKCGDQSAARMIRQLSWSTSQLQLHRYAIALDSLTHSVNERSSQTVKALHKQLQLAAVRWSESARRYSS